ncbi:TetR/AcrR family transcriptional regulator [Streptomyces sp. NBC_00053]|uniref:TetR/AcrR family transcriptional regulator n=1 Tax=unclassified Streptomyces TaxID=2593676 RepID=UPI00225AAAB0|nr:MULTISPECIES: TetR/AcrR family transcriptional regulator [unclassified Streptomyces]MCX4393143.1 TetR/AcrR family transcriptional regulator [Streptomyces sp. NBC_01767]MCX5503809.1 TetR/AcrR family transcriptional regulator [Streptomyces sp. NBC_00052]MCX5547655.1 TetR/AcrR family transcriptional regulator [Streptomyces sp. NBC_00051]
MEADRRTAILEAAARVIARRGVRGLRVPEVAAEAGVSTALAYYHFKDRAGILHRTLEFISDRAERCTVDRPAREYDNDPHHDLERSLLLEFQDRPEVRENSIAWGELQATAVFDPELRAALAGARLIWIGELTSTLARIRPAAPAPAPALTESAERLTATLEGLSTRWLSGLLSTGHARELMRDAIAMELPGRPAPHHHPLFD